MQAQVYDRQVNVPQVPQVPQSNVQQMAAPVANAYVAPSAGIVAPSPAILASVPVVEETVPPYEPAPVQKLEFVANVQSEPTVAQSTIGNVTNQYIL